MATFAATEGRPAEAELEGLPLCQPGLLSTLYRSRSGATVGLVELRYRSRAHRFRSLPARSNRYPQAPDAESPGELQVSGTTKHTPAWRRAHLLSFRHAGNHRHYPKLPGIR